MKNELRHLGEFQEILKTYETSEVLKQELKKSKFVLLTAPTGIGRNTLIRELMKSGKYHFVVSDTTRHPRYNDGVLETSGKEYWFKTEEEFIKGLREGRYLEAAIIHNQQVSGINGEEVINANNENLIAIADAEIRGAESLFKAKPDTIAIFVLPPTFDEWMRRLKNRGAMSEVEFKRRLASAIEEFDFAIKSNLFTFIVNDDLNKTVERINDIVTSEFVYADKQQKYMQLAISLNDSTKKLFSTLD